MHANSNLNPIPLDLQFVCDQGKWESKTIALINLIVAEASAMHVEKIVASGPLTPLKNVNYNLLSVGFFEISI